MTIKILNLYAGIGGNRKLWEGDLEVTAIENVQAIANIYQDFFPNDKVIVTDAHQYLLEHYKEFDFIWSSPPCPTHSRTNTFLHAQGIIRYPDLRLWQEIIFLKQWFKGKWVVENVISYYEPLIKPKIIGRHYFWSNINFEETKEETGFNIANARTSTRIETNKYLLTLEEYHGMSLTKYKICNKRLLLRNCVNPKIGKYIFDTAFKEVSK
jgi:DNA (cytosine-5)-methyltransferase 1